MPAAGPCTNRPHTRRNINPLKNIKKNCLDSSIFHSLVQMRLGVPRCPCPLTSKDKNQRKYRFQCEDKIFSEQFILRCARRIYTYLTRTSCGESWTFNYYPCRSTRDGILACLEASVSYQFHASYHAYIPRYPGICCDGPKVRTK